MYQGDEESPFNDRRTRNHFIAKVLSIVGMQLMFVSIVASFFMFCEPAKWFLIRHFYIVYLAMAVAFCIHIVLCCFMQIARQVPFNYILLIVLTIAESVMISGYVIKFDPYLVLLALLSTIVLCIMLAIFALVAPCDFTGCGPYLCVAFMILMLLGIAAAITRLKELVWIYVIIGLGLAMVALIYNIQLLVGGRKYEYDEDDYIIAAISIFLDILRIFRYLLKLLDLVCH